MQGSGLIMLVLMFVIMYFLMIRPENKRKKKAEEMRSNVKKGDVITTIGGIVGKVVKVNEETLVIETSEDRVRMEITKWAMSTNNSDAAADTKKKKNEEPSDEVPEEPVDEIPETTEEN